MTPSTLALWMDERLALLGRKATASECQLYFPAGVEKRPPECAAKAEAGVSAKR